MNRGKFNTARRGKPFNRAASRPQNNQLDESILKKAAVDEMNLLTVRLSRVEDDHRVKPPPSSNSGSRKIKLNSLPSKSQKQGGVHVKTFEEIMEEKRRKKEASSQNTSVTNNTDVKQTSSRKKKAPSKSKLSTPPSVLSPPPSPSLKPLRKSNQLLSPNITSRLDTESHTPNTSSHNSILTRTIHTTPESSQVPSNSQAVSPMMNTSVNGPKNESFDRTNRTEPFLERVDISLGFEDDEFSDTQFQPIYGPDQEEIDEEALLVDEQPETEPQLNHTEEDNSCHYETQEYDLDNEPFPDDYTVLDSPINYDDVLLGTTHDQDEEDKDEVVSLHASDDSFDAELADNAENKEAAKRRSSGKRKGYTEPSHDQRNETDLGPSNKYSKSNLHQIETRSKTETTKIIESVKPLTITDADVKKLRKNFSNLKVNIPKQVCRQHIRSVCLRERCRFIHWSNKKIDEFFRDWLKHEHSRKSSTASKSSKGGNAAEPSTLNKTPKTVFERLDESPMQVDSPLNPLAKFKQPSTQDNSHLHRNAVGGYNPDMQHTRRQEFPLHAPAHARPLMSRPFTKEDLHRPMHPDHRIHASIRPMRPGFPVQGMQRFPAPRIPPPYAPMHPPPAPRHPQSAPGMRPRLRIPLHQPHGEARFRMPSHPGVRPPGHRSPVENRIPMPDNGNFNPAAVGDRHALQGRFFPPLHSPGSHTVSKPVIAVQSIQEQQKMYKMKNTQRAEYPKVEKPPTPPTNMQMINEHFRGKDIGKAWDIIQKMDKSNNPPPIKVVEQTLLECCQVKSDIAGQVACKAFDMVKRLRGKPNLDDYKTLIKALFTAEQYIRAFEVFEEMKMAGFTPTQDMILHLVNNLTKEPERAFTLLPDMVKLNLLNSNIANELIVCAVEKGDLMSDKIWTLYQEMNKLKLQLKSETSQALLGLYADLNDWDKINIISKSLQSADVLQNETLEKLIEKAKTPDSLKYVMYLLDKLPKDRIKTLDAKALNDLLILSCTQDLKKEYQAQQLYSILKDNKVPITTEAYNLFLAALCKAELVDLAGFVCMSMLDDTSKHPPQPACIVALAKLFSKTGHMRELEKLARYALEGKVKPQDKELNKLFMHLSEEESFSQIYTLFKLSWDSNIHLNVATYRLIVSCLEDWEENPDASVEVYSAMKKVHKLSKQKSQDDSVKSDLLQGDIAKEEEHGKQDITRQANQRQLSSGSAQSNPDQEESLSAGFVQPDPDQRGNAAGFKHHDPDYERNPSAGFKQLNPDQGQRPVAQLDQHSADQQRRPGFTKHSPDHELSSLGGLEQHDPDQNLHPAGVNQSCPDQSRSPSPGFSKPNPDQGRCPSDGFTNANPDQSRIPSAGFNQPNPDQGRRPSDGFTNANPDQSRIPSAGFNQPSKDQSKSAQYNPDQEQRLSGGFRQPNLDQERRPFGGFEQSNPDQESRSSTSITHHNSDQERGPSAGFTHRNLDQERPPARFEDHHPDQSTFAGFTQPNPDQGRYRSTGFTNANPVQSRDPSAGFNKPNPHKGGIPPASFAQPFSQVGVPPAEFAKFHQHRGQHPGFPVHNPPQGGLHQSGFEQRNRYQDRMPHAGFAQPYPHQGRNPSTGDTGGISPSGFAGHATGYAPGQMERGSLPKGICHKFYLENVCHRGSNCIFKHVKNPKFQEAAVTQKPHPTDSSQAKSKTTPEEGTKPVQQTMSAFPSFSAFPISSTFNADGPFKMPATYSQNAPENKPAELKKNLPVKKDLSSSDPSDLRNSLSVKKPSSDPAGPFVYKGGFCNDTVIKKTVLKRSNSMEDLCIELPVLKRSTSMESIFTAATSQFRNTMDYYVPGIKDAEENRDWVALAQTYCEMKESELKPSEMVMRLYYLALSSSPGNCAEAFEEFVKNVFMLQDDSEGDSSPKQAGDADDKEFVGNIGVGLMRLCHDSNFYTEGYTILYTLHAYGINYCNRGGSVGVYHSKLSLTQVVVLAVELCLNLDAPQTDGALEVLRGANFGLFSPSAAKTSTEEAESLNKRRILLERLCTYFTDAGEIDKAHEVLQRIDDKGAFGIAGKVSILYNKLLRRCVELEEIDKAITIFQDMETNFISRDESTSRQLIIGLAKAGRSSFAKQIFLGSCILGFYPQLFHVDNPWSIELRCDFTEYEMLFLMERHLNLLSQHLQTTAESIGDAPFLSVRPLKICLVQKKGFNDKESIDLAWKTLRSVFDDKLNPPLVAQQTGYGMVSVDIASLRRWFLTNPTSGRHKGGTFTAGIFHNQSLRTVAPPSHRSVSSYLTPGLVERLDEAADMQEDEVEEVEEEQQRIVSFDNDNFASGSSRDTHMPQNRNKRHREKKNSMKELNAKVFRDKVAHAVCARLTVYLRKGKIAKDNFRSFARQITQEFLADDESCGNGNSVFSERTEEKIKKFVDSGVKR